MPSRGTYHVTSREEGKAAQRDQSYKSCVLAMLIFLLLCIVLILASWPWKKFHSLPDSAENEEDSIEMARIKGEHLTTTHRPEVTKDDRKKSEGAEVPFEQYPNNASTKVTEIQATGTTQETSTGIENTQRDITTTVQTFSTPETTTVEFIRNGTSSISPGAEKNRESTVKKEEAFTETFAPSTEMSETSQMMETSQKSTDSVSTTHSFENIEETTRDLKTTTASVIDYTSLQRLLVAKYFGNETSTTKKEDSMKDWLEEMESSTTQKSIESSKSSSTKAVSSSIDRIYRTTSTQPAMPSTTEKRVEITSANIIEKMTTLASQNIREPEEDICESGTCKQFASKVLSYMNHSADPCDDFYEYACGGLEADRQINERNLLLIVYETIATQARKSKHPESSQFYKYYESCLKYESSFDIHRRINLAKEHLKKVGKFYTAEKWPIGFKDFTTMFTNMLLYNRPLLFDIQPDVNEMNPDSFTLKIGPALDTNPFQFINAENLCQDENKEETLHENVDLGRLYEIYKKCRKGEKADVTGIYKALKDLGIIEDLGNAYNVSKYLDETVADINLHIINGILTFYSTESEIRDSYTSKNYVLTTLGNLEADWKMLNWTQLIHSLTGVRLGPNAKLQIYHKDHLTRAFRHLEGFADKNKLGLNNALMGLYAQNIYQDLVVPKSSRDLEKQCFHNAVHFMKKEASHLYVSSFTPNEFRGMKLLMRRIFEELKETLRTELRNSTWALEWGRDVLLEKLDDMRMSLPEVSLDNKNYSYELNITDNYFENSLTLMKKYRFMIYSALQKNPNDPEQIWTIFASPFQSSPRTIYGLNLIAMPFGSIDWSLLSEIGAHFDQLSLALIGNLVAREIAHNFDTNGIRYWNGSRYSEFALMTDNDSTKMVFEDYIDCQRSSMYQEDVEMSLPATGQRVTFKIPSLTLNERLSDVVGMRLAHDTLARLRNDASVSRLPWLDLSVSQLFYLIYAQTHCTKESLASSYVSLYENPTLPSRVRIFAAASNNKLLGESWKCPEGSQLLPTLTCGIFPHLEYRGGSPDAA